MRTLASIQQVKNISPIKDADRIECAHIQGWQVVIKKGELKQGDLCVYIEIDSQCPSDNPEFEFLSKYKYRVRTQKIRGCISQGLVLPMSVLPSDREYKLYDDVTDILKITKYEPQEELPKVTKERSKFVKFLFRYKFIRKLYNKFSMKNEDFPTKFGISKSDETRIQVLERYWDDFAGVDFDYTEKIDGTSATFFLYNNIFGVCSRNQWLKKKDYSYYWTVAKNFKMKKVLKTLKKKFNASKVVIQAEICGPKIQGNRYKLKNYTPFVFNLIIDGEPLTTPQIIEVLEGTGLQSVPYLGSYKFTTCEDVLAFVEGKSKLNPDVQREGCVFRGNPPTIGRRVSFKAISNKYLLKYEE